MSRLPGALFIVDINKEHIAVKEAQKLGIPTFAIVDTNSDPDQVDYAIPGNDDATKSIDILVSMVTDFIREGLEERQAEKSKAQDAKIKKAAAKKGAAEEADKKEEPKAKKEATPAKEEESKEEPKES
jgi:small subunit ribosomal protein S2